MKNILYIAFAAAVLTSCDGYLKEDSGDLLIPTKVEEYASVLYGEGYPNHLTDDVEWMQLLSDDAEVSTSAHRPCQNSKGDDDVFLSTGKGPFIWAQDIEYYINSYGKAYQDAYSNINACNIALENWQTMEGSQADRNLLAAQAYGLRAYAYFCLVNWYGEPYREDSAEEAKGVVIRLDSRVVRDYPERSSVADVYRQINHDLDSALVLFDVAPKVTNPYIFSKRAALLLKSRVALFQGQWDKVVEYGEQLGDNKYNLCTISTMTNVQLSHDSEYHFIAVDNPETVWMFGGRPATTGYNSYMYNAIYIDGAVFAVSQTRSDDLYRSYGDGDNRIYAFFSQDGDNCYRNIPYKYWSYYDYSQAFRTSEALLNVAEAKAQQGQLQEALDLINQLRKNRIRRSRFSEFTTDKYPTQEAVIREVRAERRRELCFEETHRWWDLRRQGCPQIKHTYYSSAKAAPEVYTLQENDRNYTLELPKSELNYNTNISPIDRRVIKPE